VIARSSLAAVGAASGIGVALAATALGAPAARKETFELSAELEARVTAHQDLVNNAGRSVDDFCRLTADTVQILDPVVIELSRFGGAAPRSPRWSRAGLPRLPARGPARPSRDRARAHGDLESLLRRACATRERAGRALQLPPGRAETELIRGPP